MIDVNKPKLTRTRITLAFAVAVIADALQYPINGVTATVVLAVPGELADFVLDVAVAIVIGRLIGFHWALMPSFFLELVPGLDLFPTWTACVAYVVIRRKKEESVPPAAQPVIDV